MISPYKAPIFLVTTDIVGLSWCSLLVLALHSLSYISLAFFAQLDDTHFINTSQTLLNLLLHLSFYYLYHIILIIHILTFKTLKSE